MLILVAVQFINVPQKIEQGGRFWAGVEKEWEGRRDGVTN